MKPFVMATSLRLYGDVILKTKAEPIKVITNDFKLLATDMITIMYGFNGVGLAANQVGMLWRIIVVDMIGAPLIMFNPEITKLSSSQRPKYESCLSLPGFSKAVTRPIYCSTKYIDLGGKKQTLNLFPKANRDAESFETVSRIIQHEVDHLNGILLIDKENN